MAVDESVWQYMKEHLGYSDKEMKRFRANPRNSAILEKGQLLLNRTIVAEVVESKNCNSQHRVGDRFVFDGVGNLLTRKNPKRVCMFALARLTPMILAIHELIYAGVDPNEIKFCRTGCFDVGVECGGWGHIILEVKAEERQR